MTLNRSARQPRFHQLLLALPLGLSLSLAVACSGGDSGNEQGGGGSGNASAGTSSAGTSNTNAGSGNTSGGSGNTSGGGLSTSVPGSKMLGSLTDAEVTQLCADLAKFASSGSFAMDLQEFGCRFGAIFGAAFANPMTDAEAQAACKMGYDTCKADPGTTMDMCSKPDASCTATVAELQACTKDSAAYLAMAVDSLPACDTLTLDELMNGGGIGDPGMEPASCTTYEMKCPDGPTLPSGGEM